MACLLLALIYVARASKRKGAEQLAVVAAVVAGLVLLWRLMDGLGFVPGLIAATPFAAAGLAWGFSDERNRFVTLAALLPVPLVLAYQFTGGAAPQWAGRYLLVSGFLLAVVGISQRARMAPWARTGFVVASVAVTAFGLLWMVQRSHEIADAADRLQARSEAVLISPNGFVPREFGATLRRQEVVVVGEPRRSAVRGRCGGGVGRTDLRPAWIWTPPPTHRRFRAGRQPVRSSCRSSAASTSASPRTHAPEPAADPARADQTDVRSGCAGRIGSSM